MATKVIITPKDGVLGDRARVKISEFGDTFIPVTEQNNVMMVFTLDGQQGLAFNQQEVDWEIVED
jgi:uncharacterized membrane-anchored protein